VYRTNWQALRVHYWHYQEALIPLFYFLLGSYQNTRGLKPAANLWAKEPSNAIIKSVMG
jgi:hypothetical protein